MLSSTPLSRISSSSWSRSVNIAWFFFVPWLFHEFLLCWRKQPFKRGLMKLSALCQIPAFFKPLSRFSVFFSNYIDWWALLKIKHGSARNRTWDLPSSYPPKGVLSTTPLNPRLQDKWICMLLFTDYCSPRREGFNRWVVFIHHFLTPGSQLLVWQNITAVYPLVLKLHNLNFDCLG